MLKLKTGLRAQGDGGPFHCVLMRQQPVKRAVWGREGNLLNTSSWVQVSHVGL